MIVEYLRRGVAAGAVAGIAYGLYMLLVGNPLSEYVHDGGHDHGHGDGGHDHGHGEHAHEAGHAVSEATTAVVSAGSGLLWAIFLGGVFAVALYLFEPALPGSSGVKSYVLAGAGFLTVSGVPWLVLPPAAPGAEHAYAIGPRLGIYVGLAVLGAITAAGAVAAYNRGRRRHAGLGFLAGAVPILVVAGVLTLTAPTVTTHPGLSGDLVTAYQGLAVLSQAALWLVIAGGFNAVRRRESGSETESTRPTDDAVAG